MLGDPKATKFWGDTTWIRQHCAKILSWGFAGGQEDLLLLSSGKASSSVKLEGRREGGWSAEIVAGGRDTQVRLEGTRGCLNPMHCLGTVPGKRSDYEWNRTLWKTLKYDDHDDELYELNMMNSMNKSSSLRAGNSIEALGHQAEEETWDSGEAISSPTLRKQSRLRDPARRHGCWLPIPQPHTGHHTPPRVSSFSQGPKWGRGGQPGDRTNSELGSHDHRPLEVRSEWECGTTLRSLQR